MAIKIDLLKEYGDKLPTNAQSPWRKAQSGKSHANAIKSKCQSCVGYEDMSEQIGNCTVWRCPLYLYRPYQKNTGEEE